MVWLFLFFVRWRIVESMKRGGYFVSVYRERRLLFVSDRVGPFVETASTAVVL